MKNYYHFKNMVEVNIRQELRFKNTDETKHFFLEEIKQNELTSRKHKKVFTTLNHIEHFLIFSISAFASLVGIPIEICKRTKTMYNSCKN